MKILKSAALLILVLFSLIIYVKYNIKTDIGYIESSNSLTYVNYLLSGKIPYLEFNLFQAPFYYILLALFIKKFSTIYGLILFHITVNTALSYLLYKLSKRLFNNNILLNLLIFALSFSFLFKTLPYYFDQPINLFWLFSILTIIYFFKYVEQAQKKYLVYTAFFLTFVVLTKHDSLLYFYGFIFQAVFFHELSLKSRDIPLFKRIIISLKHPMYLVAFTILFASPFLIFLFSKVPFLVLKFNLYEMGIVKYKFLNNISFPSLIQIGSLNFHSFVINSNALLFYLPLIVYAYGLTYIILRFKRGLLLLSSYTFWLEMTAINLGLNLFTPAWVISRTEMVIASALVGFMLTIYYIQIFNKPNLES